MKVLICFDNGDSYYNEVEYFSKYSRINAKGIKEEAQQTLIDKYGQHAKNYEITALYRQD